MRSGWPVLNRGCFGDFRPVKTVFVSTVVVSAVVASSPPPVRAFGLIRVGPCNGAVPAPVVPMAVPVPVLVLTRGVSAIRIVIIVVSV
jgi:hypothetical protein